ncbi:MAG TPA: TerC/Alx family metal homeostasis membrane protein [Gemmatimonadales bacterium]|jgi:tellurite resistance protein TerC
MIWLLFAATITLLLAIDLGVLSRRVHPLSFRGALGWTGAVFAAAVIFGAILWLRRGRVDATLFATGYVIELSLSVDNLLVFMILLKYFAVPEALQSRALQWGILGAIVMRGVMIAGGAAVLAEFHWVIYLLGLLLVVTGVRMFARGDIVVLEPARHPMIRRARRLIPLADHFDGRRFFTRGNGRLLATPLLLVVLVIEWTDLVFATDSIPAIFAITRNPLLVYTSNIFAIVGLRALYFLLAGLIERVRYLRVGVAVVLVLVGLKMLASRWITVPSLGTLAGVIVILFGAVAASRRPDHRGE